MSRKKVSSDEKEPGLFVQIPALSTDEFLHKGDHWEAGAEEGAA